MKTVSLLSIAGLGTVMLIPSSPPPADPDTCGFAEAVAWVANHRADLPTDLASLEAFDMVYRRAIVAELPTDIRIKLWQENVEAVISRHDELSANQVTFLENVRDALPAYLAKPDSAKIEQLAIEARSLLGNDVAHEAIATLGAPSPSASSRSFEECTCSVISDWCSAGMGCSGTACDEWAPIGCGTGWIWPCDGACVF